MPQFHVETEFEPETGRWIAEVVEVAAMQYGATKEEAVRAAIVLALQIVADELAHGQRAPDAFLAASAA